MHALYVNILLPLVENTEDGEGTAAPPPTNTTHMCGIQHNFKVGHLSLIPLCIQPPFTGDKVCNYVDLLGNFIPLPCNSQHSN